MRQHLAPGVEDGPIRARAADDRCAHGECDLVRGCRTGRHRRPVVERVRADAVLGHGRAQLARRPHRGRPAGRDGLHVEAGGPRLSLGLGEERDGAGPRGIREEAAEAEPVPALDLPGQGCRRLGRRRRRRVRGPCRTRRARGSPATPSPRPRAPRAAARRRRSRRRRRAGRAPPAARASTRPIRLYGIRMSSIPASAITSASPSFWQVMPRAPSATCRRAISTDLCVLTWGRFASPTASQCACQRARLCSSRSTSTTTAGVSTSITISRRRAGRPPRSRRGSRRAALPAPSSARDTAPRTRRGRPR